MLLMKDYTKFKCFRTFGIRLESEKTKEEVLASRCIMCPRRHLPPCRDADHPSFRGTPEGRTADPFFRPRSEPDFRWPDLVKLLSTETSCSVKLRKLWWVLHTKEVLPDVLLVSRAGLGVLAPSRDTLVLPGVKCTCRHQRTCRPQHVTVWFCTWGVQKSVDRAADRRDVDQQTVPDRDTQVSSSSLLFKMPLGVTLISLRYLVEVQVYFWRSPDGRHLLSKSYITHHYCKFSQICYHHFIT